MTETKTISNNFIRSIVEEDLGKGKHKTVVTRFPPEPNGYLHIGHAKSICLNFGLAKMFSGRCHLRMDDTNPEKENEEYVEAIKRDVKWLGFDWNEHYYHASDYFDQIYKYAQDLVKANKAFVCELNPEQMREYRGTLTSPGRNSPFRDRPIEESLDLLERMKNGEFPEGRYTLRAKIDMASPNINLRDPAMYRIKRIPHQNTGTKWNIYPMYDFAHCVSDALEGITHSICTLEFEDHRPLYDWYLSQLNVPCHPQQIEFARLNLEYTIMSKRNLLQLVNERHVSGWDDPRMPTISGMRRRGYTPAGMRLFAERIGVTKQDSMIEIGQLEGAIRDDLDATAKRVLGVVNPLKVIITNYSENDVQEIDAPYHPKNESFGRRTVPFTKEIYIEQSDFMENPPKDYHRLSPDGQVRLRYAYVLTCENVVKNTDGSIKELHCKYHSDTFAGKTPEGMKKVKGVINWVSATRSLKIECRIFDYLLTVKNPADFDGKNFLDFLNPKSLEVKESFVEESVKGVKPGTTFQFERQGYFCVDLDSTDSKLVFNKTVGLKDSYK